jgi:Nucleotidyl transferase AbiEii toxin, Type IV TA system
VSAVASLAPASAELVARLGVRPWAADFYLAGSAALAIHVRHRRVRDLDLMSPANRLAPQDRRDLLADLLEVDPDTTVETARDGYLFVRSAAGVGVRLFHYPYPLVEPLGEHAGLAVAAPVDLALMKLAAVISRGGRRDFVDLYLLRRRTPLGELLARAPEKFGHVRDFPLQALKGLADRSAAAGEPMPPLAEAVSWLEVERWLDGEVRELGRRHVGLEEA